MFIKDFVLFNPKGKKPTDYVNYIDTSSVEDGKLLGIQYLTDNIPSRAQRVIEEGDILISSVRPILKHNYYVSQTIENGIASTGFIQIRADRSKVIPQYLYYFLTEENKVRMYQTIAETSQSTFPSFNKDVIENMAFPDVSLAEQQHIVDILGTLDDKIENNTKKAEEYEKMIELYFEQLLSEKTNEWNEQSLLDIAEYTNGLAMQKFRPRGIDYLPVVKIKELSQGRTDSNSEQADVAIGNKFIIDDGDIVFAWSGTLVVKIWCGGKAGLNQHLFKVTSEKYPKWFVYLWTKHHLIKFQNIAKGKAVTMGHIKRDDLAKSSAFIPPSNTFAQYDRIIAPIYERIVILQQENRKLMSLKSQYLQRFFG